MSITHEQAEKDCGWLGLIRAIHSIGPYDFVEWQDQKSGDTLFGGFMDGKSLSESWHSLDEAMIGVVARKHEGLNSRAAPYFFRMVGIR